MWNISGKESGGGDWEMWKKNTHVLAVFWKQKNPIYQMPYRYNYALILSKAVSIKLIKLLEY